ncbi:MAG: hypothetical protein ACTSRU_11360 [Candidatus Hodarchaeales archaeon]
MSEEPGKPLLSIVLHAYQPPYPFQQENIVERIVKNTYIPVPRILRENGIPVTVNINGSLSEILESDFPDVIEELILLYDSGFLEFLGSGCYHPILPLIPSSEIKRQVKLNEKINKRVFGNRYNPAGFFPPELAVSPEIIPVIRSLGYEYIMMPNTATYGVTSRTPFFNLNDLLTGVTRNKEISNTMSFRNYSDVDAFTSHLLHQQKYYQSPTVLAMDMETYGEHHKDYYKFLVKCLKRCKVLKTEELLKKSSDRTLLETFKACSWSTGVEEANQGNGFPLWDDPSNAIHQLQNTHLSLVNGLAEKVLDQNRTTNNAYKMVAKCQTSCQFWWASRGRFSRELIIRGIELQRSALTELVKLSEFDNSDFYLEISDTLIKSLNRVLNIKTR